MNGSEITSIIGQSAGGFLGQSFGGATGAMAGSMLGAAVAFVNTPASHAPHAQLSTAPKHQPS